MNPAWRLVAEAPAVPGLDTLRSAGTSSQAENMVTSDQEDDTRMTFECIHVHELL